MKRAITLLLALAVWALPVYAQDGEALKTQVTSLNEQITKAKEAASAKPDDAALKTALDDLHAQRTDALAALKDQISKMEKGDARSKLNEFYLEESGDLSNLDATAAVGLVAKYLNKVKDWAINDGPGILGKILGFLLILLLFKFLARTGGRITDAAMEKSKLDVSALLRNFFVNVVTKLIFFTGLVFALSYIGIDTGPLLAGLGVAGFVIGFALQGTMSNFASGVMILLYRPYDIGHVITAAGVTGSVEAMTLVSTTIKTPDNQRHIVPNNSIWGGVITNVTSQPTRRVDLTIGVGYGDDLDKTAAALNEVVNGHELVLQDPAPTIEVANLGASSVDFIVRPWTKTSDYWRVTFDLNKQIKQRLDAEGISIPYPQQDVHVVTLPEKSA